MHLVSIYCTYACRSLHAHSRSKTIFTPVISSHLISYELKCNAIQWKSLLLKQDTDLHPMCDMLWLTQNHPKRHLDRLVHLCRDHRCDRQTSDKQTDHITKPVPIGHFRFQTSPFSSVISRLTFNFYCNSLSRIYVSEQFQDIYTELCNTPVDSFCSVGEDTLVA